MVNDMVNDTSMVMIWLMMGICGGFLSHRGGPINHHEYLGDWDFPVHKNHPAAIGGVPPGTAMETSIW